MRFLNPKTDLAFKKIFGSDSSSEIVISFLNALLKLTGDETITSVTILDPYQAPKIEGMKDTFLDVRVKDLHGRSYVVEMQVLNVPGFEKRVLYNACKAYVGQLAKGDGYHLLGDVVAVTITDFIMFPELERVISQFRLLADENKLIRYRDLELVFAELPKFSKTEDQLETTLERWLYFMKTAGDLTAVPRALAVEPAILMALEIANRAAWTDEELDAQIKREMWISDQLRIREDAKNAREELSKARQEAEQMAQQMARMAKQEGMTEGKAEGKAEMLLHLLPMRCGPVSPEIEERVRKASSDQLDEWSIRLMNAHTLEDVFGAPTTH
ncbi:MAG: Rpn family recombination-promoting nuclease/putative transposase [Alphaproteobacteria bacterium]